MLVTRTDQRVNHGQLILMINVSNEKLILVNLQSLCSFFNLCVLLRVRVLALASINQSDSTVL